MAAPYTHMSVLDAEDAAEKFGMSESQESRFLHGEAEEVYFVVSGSGRIKLDDEILDLRPREAVRVSPGVMRAFEAGPEGLEILAFGRRHAQDPGEVVPGWWSAS